MTNTDQNGVATEKDARPRPADAVKVAAVRVLDQWDSLGQFDGGNRTMAGVINELRAAVLATNPAPAEPPLVWEVTPETHTARCGGKTVGVVRRTDAGLFEWVETGVPGVTLFRTLAAALEAVARAAAVLADCGKSKQTARARSVEWQDIITASIGRVNGRWVYTLTRNVDGWLVSGSLATELLFRPHPTRLAAKTACEEHQRKAVGQ